MAAPLLAALGRIGASMGRAATSIGKGLGNLGKVGFTDLSGKFGQLASGLSGTIQVMQKLKPVVEGLTKAYVFGIDYFKSKIVQVGTEYLEGFEIFKTFNINFGSQYNTPFGTTKYWDDTLRAINSANKQLGIAGNFSEQIRKNILVTGEQTLALGFSQKELTETYRTFTESYGRNIMLSGNELASMTKISNTLGENYNQIFGLTKLYGASIENTFDFLDQSNKEVDKLGLNTKKVFGDIQSNIRLIDKFNFKNGVQGLSNMAKQANRLGMEMQSISNFADKVYNPEDAIEAAASLQMLGGEFAKLGDPFSLLYDANNDLEALTEKLAEVTKGMGALNRQTGMIDLSPLEMRQLRSFSSITGQSVEELARQAKLAKKEDIVEQNLAPNLRQYTAKIAGMVSFEKGVGTVNIDGIKKSIKDLTEAEIIKLSTITEEAGKSSFDTLATANQTTVEQLEIFAQKVVMASNNLETLAIETKNAKDSLANFYRGLNDPSSLTNLGISKSNEYKRGMATEAGKVARGEDTLSKFFSSMSTAPQLGSSTYYNIKKQIESDRSSNVQGQKPELNVGQQTSFKSQDSNLKTVSSVQKSSTITSNNNNTNTNNTNVNFLTGETLSMKVYVDNKPTTTIDLSKDTKFMEAILKSTDSNGGRNTGPYK